LAAHTPTACRSPDVAWSRGASHTDFIVSIPQWRASTIDYGLGCAFRHAAGGIPTIRLKARIASADGRGTARTAHGARNAISRPCGRDRQIADAPRVIRTFMHEREPVADKLAADMAGAAFVD